MDAFVSSCFAGHMSLEKIIDMCLASACSLRQHHRQMPSTTFHYLVNDAVPSDVRRTLATMVDTLEVVPQLRWPSSAGPRPPSSRAYSFQKLRVWNLTQYARVLYFDPDVFWVGDARRYLSRYGHARHLAAAEYTGDIAVSAAALEPPQPTGKTCEPHSAICASVDLKVLLPVTSPL